jgi:predicted nucleic acid-binding protein
MNIAAALADVTRIGLDTAPIIYYVEKQSDYFPLSLALFERIGRGSLRGYSSVITLTEVLVHPRRTGNDTVVRAYEALLLDSERFSLLSINAAIADTAATLRARHNLRTPDALQIATALAAGCEVFVTNDRALRRVTELRVVTLDDLAPMTE